MGCQKGRCKGTDCRARTKPQAQPPKPTWLCHSKALPPQFPCQTMMVVSPSLVNCFETSPREGLREPLVFCPSDAFAVLPRPRDVHVCPQRKGQDLEAKCTQLTSSKVQIQRGALLTVERVWASTRFPVAWQHCPGDPLQAQSRLIPGHAV